MFALSLKSYRKAVFCDFERELFCGEQAGVPVLSPREYEKHCADLSCVVSSLELNIKKLLKDYDGKKKVCVCASVYYTGRGKCSAPASRISAPL